VIDPWSQPDVEFWGKVTNFSFGELDHLSEYYKFFDYYETALLTRKNE
jgi:hypothetical protein